MTRTVENMMKSFQDLIEIKQDSAGRWIAMCPKGNFMVDSFFHQSCRAEALHYFRKYYMDGEYDE